MKTHLFLALLYLLLFGSCYDIIVPDISTENILLTAPPDSLRTNDSRILFYWEGLEEIEEYQLQIVSPSYDSLISVVLDTFINNSQFEYVLDEGNYQWSVVGFNESYQTDCCEIRTLFIKNDTSANLSQQYVNLTSPLPNAYINTNGITFLWTELFAADRYILQVGNEDFSNIQIQKELSGNFHSTSLGADGIYYWRVRAENLATQTFTNWSEQYFIIDRLAPNAPILNFPENQDSIALTDQNPDLIWENEIGVIADSLFVYQDENKDTLLLELYLLDETFDFDGGSVFLVPEDYFWQLISFDAAGNTSGESELFRFVVKL